MKRFAFIAFATVLSFTPAIAADNSAGTPKANAGADTSTGAQQQSSAPTGSGAATDMKPANGAAESSDTSTGAKQQSSAPPGSDAANPSQPDDGDMTNNEFRELVARDIALQKPGLSLAVPGFYFYTKNLYPALMDPLHATLEESNCPRSRVIRLRPTSFLKSRWGLRLTGWRAGCAALNAEARCCRSSRGGKRTQAGGLGADLKRKPGLGAKVRRVGRQDKCAASNALPEW